MQETNTTEDHAGFPYSVLRGTVPEYELEDPTALAYQQRGALTGTTEEELPDGTQPIGSVSMRAGSTAARAEQGAEDAPLGDTTPTRGPVTRAESSKQAARNRKPLIRMATLNIRGCGSRAMGSKSKLAYLVSWMRANKIGIVALQETYETELAFAAAEKANAKVWAFPNKGSAHSAGTGFVVHRDGIPANLSKNSFEHEVITQGRVSTLSFEWGEERIKLTNLYVPNEERVAIDFLTETVTKLRSKNPDIIMGDMNHVSDAMDRLPSRHQLSQRIVRALNDLNSILKVSDVWRADNPNTNDFTWESTHANQDGTVSRSRIDRILVTDKLEDRVMKHYIDHSLRTSDHTPVVMELIDDAAPYIGPPRWKMNLEDVNDKALMELVRPVLLKCGRPGVRDPMAAWIAAKEKIKNLTYDRQRTRRKERGKHLKLLKTQREKTTKRSDFRQNKGLQANEAALRDRIAMIEKAKLDRSAESSAARYADKGESVNRYWFSIGKSINESSVIRSLKNGESGITFETNKMSDIARAHHEGLQAKPPMTDARHEAISRMERMTDGKRMTSKNRASLKRPFTMVDARAAIKAAQTGKSPGCDGIPYEFYKYWVKRLEHKKDDEPEVPDIARTLARVVRVVDSYRENWTRRAVRESKGCK